MNFQNIPRRDKVVKQAFRAKHDALLMFDYKQIEPRLLAFYMASIGDVTLASYIRGGTDPYSAIVTEFLGRPDFTEEERQNAKIVFLSQMYGGGNRPVAEAFGCSWPEAGRITRDFHAAWPGVRRLQAAIGNRMDERGYITTLWGRHLHPKEEHKYINVLIQGCAADLMKAGAVKVAHYLNGAGLAGYLFESHLVNLVHDELMLDVVFTELELLVRDIPPLMDHPPVSSVVPIGVDVEIGIKSWADKEAVAA